jgi:hypothetical protein
MSDRIQGIRCGDMIDPLPKDQLSLLVIRSLRVSEAGFEEFKEQVT